MADRTVQLVLQYDGAQFAGWQRQPSARTVQGVLEQVFERLMGSLVPVTGAGRTDSGVHARGQAAHVTVPAKWTASALRRSVNALLPGDLWVAAAHEMLPEFHARYSALSRAYTYYVGTDDEADSPFRCRYEWRAPASLDVSALREAASAVIGEHEFRGFAVRGTAPDSDHHRCTVVRSEWSPRPGGYVFTIQANRFLHHMVRFLVGTMIDVATGRRTLASLRDLLSSSDNRGVSPPAPPHGLFLDRVEYPAHLYFERA